MIVIIFPILFVIFISIIVALIYLNDVRLVNLTSQGTFQECTDHKILQFPKSSSIESVQMNL